MGAHNAIPIQMPDGSIAASQVEAAARLGVAESTITHHMRKFGHLRNIAPNRASVANSARGIRRGEGGAVAARGITLDRAEYEAGAPVDFARAETAPRHSHMVGSRVQEVIETIRACRDQYLGGKQS